MSPLGYGASLELRGKGLGDGVAIGQRVGQDRKRLMSDRMTQDPLAKRLHAVKGLSLIHI